MRTRAAVAALLLSLASLAGCTSSKMQTQLTTPSQEPRQASTTSGAVGERAVGWPDLGRGEARFIRIDLGPDSYAECQRISPKFPFDSASTYAIDRAQLAAFADCMNSPTMRGTNIVLVGRADPRGTDSYNDKLGTRRAAAIKQLLVEQGIDEGRIFIESEGKAGAVGVEENAIGDRNDPKFSYGHDRRVDVVVVGNAHAP